MVAIVGTRNASSYGLAAAQKFAEVLARAGAVVVSGGAIGIDTAAHSGALQAGGQTVAVLGTGIDQVHPAENRELFDQIAKQGLLVSQYACAERGDRASFIQRNDVIAGLAHAVLVVELPAKSGALATARAASEFGREVFAVPGMITMHNFYGSHNLIRNGATLVDSPDQILQALEKTLPEERPEPDEGEDPLNPLAGQIVAHLQREPLSLDRLQELTGLSVSDLMAELTTLELEGVLFQDANGYSLRP
jgi:DNA processing protein